MNFYRLFSTFAPKRARHVAAATNAIGHSLFLRRTARRIALIAGLTAGFAAHATVCVNSVQGLRDALSAAQANGADDVIHVARGFYATGGTPFSFDSSETHALTIIGGYNSNCSTRVYNPALTVLDGGGTSLVFGSESTGKVTLRFLTFQGGSGGGIAGAALRMNFFDQSTGSLVVSQSIVRESGYAAFSLAVWGSATLNFFDNLVVDNLADTWTGGPEIYCGGSGAVTVINNTFANNVVTSADPRVIGGLVLLGPHTSAATLSNNIFWGNTNSDLYSASAIMIDNDYGTDSHSPAAGSSGNHSFDPKFSSSSDYHLLPSSPLLGIGTLTPVGGLPNMDIEGHARTDNGKVDLGPYERGNEIFADGFDD